MARPPTTPPATAPVLLLVGLRALEGFKLGLLLPELELPPDAAEEVAWETAVAGPVCEVTEKTCVVGSCRVTLEVACTVADVDDRALEGAVVEAFGGEVLDGWIVSVFTAFWTTLQWRSVQFERVPKTAYVGCAS